MPPASCLCADSFFSIHAFTLDSSSPANLEPSEQKLGVAKFCSSTLDAPRQLQDSFCSIHTFTLDSSSPADLEPKEHKLVVAKFPWTKQRQRTKSKVY